MEQARRAHEIFRASLDVPVEQREAFVARRCDDDAALRHEVDALLHAGSRAGAFLETPAIALAGSLAQSFADAAGGVALADDLDTPHPMIGRRIGRYTILSLIASGGMGAVFLAEQDQPRRKVALKVMRGAGMSRSALRRFEYESQILARLQHPHIAQVFEAGMHDDGTASMPYFAMEYVADALPMTRFAEEHHLPQDDRLGLFLQACDAVHFGHQRGVIHRDLKPANILVAPPADGLKPVCRGTVKIIDFGVARVLDPEIARGATLAHTEAGMLLGTVAYMSPEQFEADGSRVDVRSDVYALGVTLYELLTGRLPYELAHSGVYESAKIVRENRPALPTCDGQPLPIDLRTITLKSLEKEPHLRYQSAAELAGDIRRYLNHQPIEARPPSVLYHAKLFARRHTGLVAGLALAAALLVAGAVASTVLAFGQAAARRLAENREHEAQRQADIARETVAFLNDDLLAAADPYASPDPNLTVRQALDAASQRIEGRFAGEPHVEAAVRMTLGRMYLNLGRYGEAETHLLRALELRSDTLPDDDAFLLEAHHEVGWLRYHQQRYDDAERVLRAVLPQRTRVLGAEHIDTLQTMHVLASICVRRGQWEEAERLMVHVLDAQRRTLGEDHDKITESIDGLARLHMTRGHYAAAEPLYQEALARSLARYGPDHRVTLYATGNVARLHLRQGRHDEAERGLSDVWPRAQRLLGENHPDTLVYMTDLGGLHMNKRRFDFADFLLRNALERSRRVHGEEHASTLQCIMALAMLRSRQGQGAEAERLYRDALEASQRTFGDDHVDTLRIMSSLGFLLDGRGQREEAERLLRTALEGQRRALGEDHPDAMNSLNNLAFTIGNQQRNEEAEKMFRDVIALRTRVLGPLHPDTAISLSNLGHILGVQQRWEDAVEVLRESVKAWREGPGKGQALSANALGNLGAILLRLNQPKESEELFRECLAVQQATLSEGDPTIAVTKSLLGHTLTSLSRYEDAEPLLLEGWEGLQSSPPAMRQRAIERIVRLYDTWGKPEEAARWRDANEQ